MIELGNTATLYNAKIYVVKARLIAALSNYIARFTTNAIVYLNNKEAVI